MVSMEEKSLRIKEIAYASIFVALTIVGAQLSVPVGPVPVTFQTLFVILSSLVLGARLGFLTQLTYILIGAAGFPVFAGFSGGVVQLYGPLGGYLIAFPIAAFLGGLISEKNRNAKNYFIAAAAEIGIIYILGWFRLGFYIHGFKKALLIGVAPFLPWDLLKAVLAVYIARVVQKHTKTI
jgi:biotin transport system substrate-specific component